jgi:hypothetical protein
MSTAVLGSGVRERAVAGNRRIHCGYILLNWAFLLSTQWSFLELGWPGPPQCTGQHFKSILEGLACAKGQLVGNTVCLPILLPTPEVPESGHLLLIPWLGRNTPYSCPPDIEQLSVFKHVRPAWLWQDGAAAPRETEPAVSINDLSLGDPASRSRQDPSRDQNRSLHLPAGIDLPLLAPRSHR